MRAKTIPPKYDRPLSAEMSEARARTEEHERVTEAEINALERQPNKSVPEMRRLLRLRNKLRRIQLSLHYQGADPKRVERADLKEIVREPVFNDAIEDKYRANIKNRATAIRAYCVTCQSGQPSYVRECVNIVCPLWPFRMGKDPFRGYDLPKLHIELDAADETESDFEDGDDGDESDAD